MAGGVFLQALGRRRFAAPAAAAGALALALLATAGMAGPAASARRPSAAPAVTVSLPVEAKVAPPAAIEQGEPRLERFTGPVGPDLSEALRNAGVQPATAREYIRQMLSAANLADGLSVADRYDLVTAAVPGQAPLLVYAGLDRVGRGDIQLFKWSDGRHTRWLDAAGLGRDQGGLALPLKGRITSGFGGRMHPILGYLRFHRGVDLAAAWGTPVTAAADGRVSKAGWHGGYGRLVSILHEGGLETDYGHMSRIVAQPGQAVRRGQLIGYVGSSGLSTGPHLHFEVRRGGHAVNPLSARLSTPIALQGEQLHAFRDQLRFVLELPRSGA